MMFWLRQISETSGWNCIPKLPCTGANFVKLIKEGNLDDAEFYRVVYEFMIQGGEPAL